MTDLFPQAIIKQATKLLEQCRKKRIRLVTAESCTGGLIAGILTEVAGSSDVVECGYITYSNHAKITLLGVQENTINAHGAVSGETAAQMTRGALINHNKEFTDTHSYISVAVTGIAGPSGGSAEKPVGTVWISGAKMVDGGISCHTEHHVFDGDRTSIRIQTVKAALNVMLKKAEQI